MEQDFTYVFCNANGCICSSYMLNAKKNIIFCIWCNAMRLRGSRFKNILFSTYCTLLLLLYAPPFWNPGSNSIFTNLIVLRSEVYSDWPAIQCVVIGRIPKVCDGNGNETKPIKPIMNEAFVAFSEDIITDSMTRLFTRHDGHTMTTKT